MLTAIAALVLTQQPGAAAKPLTQLAVRIKFANLEKPVDWKAMPGKATIIEKPVAQCPDRVTLFTGNTIGFFGAIDGQSVKPGQEAGESTVKLFSSPILRTQAGQSGVVTQAVNQERAIQLSISVSQNQKDPFLMDATVSYSPSVRKDGDQSAWPFVHRATLSRTQTLVLSVPGDNGYVIAMEFEPNN